MFLWRNKKNINTFGLEKAHLTSATCMFYTTLLNGLFPIAWCLVSLLLILLCIIEIPVFHANCADADLTPHSADLGLHCLPINLLGVSRLK